MREIDIFIYLVEWVICEPNFDEDYEGNTSKNPAAITKLRDNKIILVFDTFEPSDKLIKEAEGYDTFHEKCKFYHKEVENEKIINTFEGTFIDALKYIQKNFK
ncbi:MAG: hypothetical protein K5978_00595 [Campylobacter sp.]|nr:hypothetical protein [Campylobacter sp.]